MLKDNSRLVGLPVGCTQVVDGLSDRRLEITRIWVSYISMKRVKVQLYCPVSNKASLLGTDVFIFKHLDVGEGFRVKGLDQFNLGCWPK